VEIHASARRHRVADEDIRHAIVHAVYSADIADDEPPKRVLYLGPDRAANLLEIVVMELDDGSELAIHAMKIRPKYEKLLNGR
jgi:hypothetical protein